MNFTSQTNPSSDECDGETFKNHLEVLRILAYIDVGCYAALLALVLFAGLVLVDGNSNATAPAPTTATVSRFWVFVPSA